MAEDFSVDMYSKLKDLLISKGVSESEIADCEEDVKSGKYQDLIEAFNDKKLISADEVQSLFASLEKPKPKKESIGFGFQPPTFDQESELFVPNLQPIFDDDEVSNTQSKTEEQVYEAQELSDSAFDVPSKYSVQNIATSEDLEENSLKSKKPVSFNTASLRAGIVTKIEDDDNFESEYIAPPPVGSTRRKKTLMSDENSEFNVSYGPKKFLESEDISQASTRVHRKVPKMFEEKKEEIAEPEVVEIVEPEPAIDLSKLAGHKIADRYELIEPISYGRNSAVYKAIKFKSSRKKFYAIKILSPIANDPAMYLKRFKQEAELLQRLSHGPNIVRINAFGKDKEIYYLAMNYVEGETLADLIARKAPLNQDLTMQIISEVLRALHHAHSNGVIHRDIKSANILIGKNGTVLLTDFGLALDVSDVNKNAKKGQLLGTPHYMAPEQINNEDVDGRTDLYSLGVVFYECLTGKRPFEEATDLLLLSSIVSKTPEKPSKFNPEISKIIEKIILQLLKKEPRARFKNAKEVYDVIVKNKKKKPSQEPKPEIKTSTNVTQNLVEKAKTMTEDVEVVSTVKDSSVELLADEESFAGIPYPGLKPGESSRQEKKSTRSKRVANINQEKYKHSIEKSQRIVAVYKRPKLRMLKIIVAIIILGSLFAAGYKIISSL